MRSSRLRLTTCRLFVSAFDLRPSAALASALPAVVVAPVAAARWRQQGPQAGRRGNAASVKLLLVPQVLAVWESRAPVQRQAAAAAAIDKEGPLPQVTLPGGTPLPVPSAWYLTARTVHQCLRRDVDSGVTRLVSARRRYNVLPRPGWPPKALVAHLRGWQTRPIPPGLLQAVTAHAAPRCAWCAHPGQGTHCLPRTAAELALLALVPICMWSPQLSQGRPLLQSVLPQVPQREISARTSCHTSRLQPPHAALRASLCRILRHPRGALRLA